MKVSFYENKHTDDLQSLRISPHEEVVEGAQPNLEPVSIFNNTKYHRTEYLRTVFAIVTDAILPLTSLVASFLNVLQLFFIGEFNLGWVGLTLFLLPTFLVLFYYLENMFHRQNKLLELFLIAVFGPFLRWFCSVRLLILKLGVEDTNASMEAGDLSNFIYAAKMLDGIFQTSMQVIWLLYLIAIEVYPFPLFDLTTREVTDWFGNVFHLPVLSSLTLYSSLAVLVKNLSELWMSHIPTATNRSGSETIIQSKEYGKCRKFLQWILLIMFVLAGVLYRLMSYLLLFVHLNVFLMPGAGIVLVSFVMHILLRGLSNRFYVDSGKMDVFLTACCCALVPTPTSSNIRAHNLLQAHSVITNLLLMVSLGVCMFLSVDYSLPIINRPWQLRYSSTYFFNYCLIVILLLPVSMMLYALFKKSLGANVLSDRKTMFWTNKKPTLMAVSTGIMSTIIMTLLVVINLLGRYSSTQCSLAPGLFVHGEVRPLAQGVGTSVQCPPSYTAAPAASVFCRWFFGPEGFIDMSPAYSKDLVSLPEKNENSTVYLSQYKNIDTSIAFVRNMSALDCVKNNKKLACLNTVPSETCSVSELMSRDISRGKWKCNGYVCVLSCEVS